MTDEIKEINIKFPGQILDYVDTKEHLLELFNYITNLQEELERYQHYSKTTGIEELMAENERLKKELNALRISEEEWLNETLGGDEE